ncbi:hypothetical protein DAEQUDRAFT_672247, partial [Daedalea quercina L-15889]
SYVFGWADASASLAATLLKLSLFITLSRLIWGIDFSAPLDPKPQRPVVPDIANEEATWSKGFVSAPYPFEVKFAARSATHTELICSSFNAVQSEWRRMRLDVDERQSLSAS